MTFTEWLQENHGYIGDGSEFDIQSSYSAGEIDHLYSKYDREYGDGEDYIQMVLDSMPPEHRKKKARKERFMPYGIPKYVRCYDNDGETVDRYTVVFTGHFKGRDGICYYLGMSKDPFHPQGFGQHGESRDIIDRPTYGHLGKKIKFTDLPWDCRTCVIDDYKEIWRF